MAVQRRERVCIDLRGLGEKLQVHADARGLAAAAVVRSALREWLADSDGDAASPVKGASKQACLKVTLRIPVGHAVLLARRARAAEVSQGNYVADLLEGLPPRPVTPALEQAASALAGSTYQLAALSSDINAHLRAMGAGDRRGFEHYRANSDPVPELIGRHLALASQVVAALRPARCGRKASRLKGA